jgi:hypothetical protein
MRVTVRSVFDQSPEFVWEKVQTSALLLHVLRPLVRVEPPAGRPFPERWREGDEVTCRMYLFGVLPLGWHAIRFVRIDPRARQIRTDETGRLVRQWRHVVSVSPAEDGRALYSDEVEIHAGPLTPFVWAFARVMYEHRHRRWRALARGTGPALARG